VIDLSLVFLTGVLASVHCIGMCGPIVLAYSTIGVRDKPCGKKASVLTLHAAYNGGRILSYALVGAFVGLVGTTLGALKTAGEYVSIIGGAAMVLFGLGMLGVLFFKPRNAQSQLASMVSELYGGLLKKRTWGSKLSLGLLTPLLPCGMLYAMLIKAMTTGTATTGALTMATFGIGMAPSLILMGGLSSLLSARMRKGAQHLAALTVVLMGVILILRGLHVPYLAWLSGGNGSHAH